MMMILLALLMGLGVLFGSGAMVVDLGYGMAQQGAMQNAADAGALAAGKLMAGSVSITAGGNAVYVLTDNQIHRQVQSLVVDNFQGDVRLPRDPTSSDYTYAVGTTWLNTTSFTEFHLTSVDTIKHVATWSPLSTHQLAVQYLACPGSTDGTPNFTASSDQDLVNALGGTRFSSTLADNVGVGSGTGWNWPTSICMLRVWTRESHAPLLAAALPGWGTTPERELAHATVRIAPTTAPTDVSNVWPIVAWDDPSQWDQPYVHDDPSTNGACPFVPGSPCTFWSSSAAPGGSKFKGVINLSRFSVLGFATPKPEQDFNCDGDLTKKETGCSDPSHPGNSTPQGGSGDKVDIDYWLRNAWRGHVYINENDPRCTDSVRHDIVSECPNSRAELYQGTGGSNVGTPIGDYINAAPDGKDANGKNFRTVSVLFWSYGEENVATSCKTPPGTCVVDRGTLWKGVGANGKKVDANNLQATGRVILSKVRRYRFVNNTTDVTNSSVSGYYVSFYNPNGTPGDGHPSDVANMVSLVG